MNISQRRGRLFAIACGSSYHAAKAAALFFNEIAQVELIPILPGEFRGQHSRSLRDGDLFLAISQSGETKDLIDVLIDKGASLGERLDALWFAWVKAFPDVIPKVGMDADNVIDLDTRRQMN